MVEFNKDLILKNGVGICCEDKSQVEKLLKWADYEGLKWKNGERYVENGKVNSRWFFNLKYIYYELSNGSFSHFSDGYYKTYKYEEIILKKEDLQMETNKNKKGMFGMDMSKMMSGFNMRTLSEDEVAMGMDGKTYFKRKNGDYVRYDVESRTIVNTHNMKFDFGMAMIIPSPTVQAGDMIVNGDDFVYITSIKDNKIFGVGLNSGRTKSIIVEKSTMGFSFYQKVVNMMDGMGQQTGGMFGGMNPMMLMMMNKEEGKNSNMMEMMMMSQMMGGNNMFAQPQISQPIATNNTITQEPMTDEEIEAEIERLKNMKTK